MAKKSTDPLAKYLFAKPVARDPSKFMVNQIVSPMAGAIAVAENNKRNNGVLSVPTRNAADAKAVTKESIINNYWRWLSAIDAGATNIPFVDFMQRRWAPIGAENDPKNLNKNWAPNVRATLLKILGPEGYANWKALNLVKAKQLLNTGVS